MTATTNPVLEGIRSRRSIGRVTEQIPSRELIEQLLEAAITAPNHYLTEPWRFFVLTGDARLELGDAMVAARLEGETDPDSVPELVLDKVRAKPLRAPVVIGVAVQPTHGEKVWPVEEICATAAAIQNLLLAADSLGLAAMWRTGDPCYSKPVKQYFGLGPDDTMLGMIYVGYPAVEPKVSPRSSIERVTEWRGNGWTSSG